MVEGKYNLLIISPIYFPYHVGGAEISTQLMAESLSKTGRFNIDIFTHGERHSSEDVVGGIKVIRHSFPISSRPVFSLIHHKKVPMPLKILGKVGDLFPNQARENMYRKLFSKYDVVILSGNGTKLGRCDIWHAAKKAGVPMIQIVRDPLLLYAMDNTAARFPWIDLFYRKLSTFRLNEVPYVVGITAWILEQHQKHGVTFNSTEVIYNMVPDTLCRSVPYKDKENIILYVGAVSKIKGCDTLIKTFRKMKDSIPSYRLELIGNVNDANIPDDDRIIVQGHLALSEVYDRMSRAKLLVLPSEWDEAFGRVLIESVFNGTIAIGSDRGGIPEVFNFNKKCIFEAGNPESLESIILEYSTLNEAEYQDALCVQQLLFKRYSANRTTEKWVNYLLSIIEKRKSLRLK